MQGGLYKGKLLGTLGHSGAMSLMSGKPLPIGGGEMLITNDEGIHERALAFSHYECTDQLKHPELKRFAGLPRIRPHRPPKGSGSTMGGWYAAHELYVAEELGGLSIHKLCEAVRAEGVRDCHPGANFPLHLYPMLSEADICGHGKPTRIANPDRGVRQLKGSLPVTESIPGRIHTIPWFKRHRPRIIEEHAEAFRKVAEHSDELLCS